MQRKRGTGTTGLNLLAPTFFPSTMMHTWTCMYIRMLGSFVLFFTVVALSVSPATWWISKNKKRRRRGWVLTIRRRDQATHTLMSQSCFLMCLCTAGHINTSTADASILNNPKKPRESVISWLCNGNDEAGHVWTAHLLPTLSQTPFLLCTALFLQHVIDSRPLSPP